MRKREAVKHHRAKWDWLSENPTKIVRPQGWIRFTSKMNWPGWKFIESRRGESWNLSRVRFLHLHFHSCFACLVTHQHHGLQADRCSRHCLFLWDKSRHCASGEFGDWTCAKTAEERAYWAKVIASLPVRYPNRSRVKIK